MKNKTVKRFFGIWNYNIIIFIKVENRQSYTVRWKGGVFWGSFSFLFLVCEQSVFWGLKSEIGHWTVYKHQLLEQMKGGKFMRNLH